MLLLSAAYAHMCNACITQDKGIIRKLDPNIRPKTAPPRCPTVSLCVPHR